MRVRIAPKIVLRVSTALVLSASLANVLASVRRGVGNREHAFISHLRLR